MGLRFRQDEGILGDKVVFAGKDIIGTIRVNFTARDVSNRIRSIECDIVNGSFRGSKENDEVVARVDEMG